MMARGRLRPAAQSAKADAKNNVAVAVSGATVPPRSGRPRADALGEPLATTVADGSRLYLETVRVVVKNNGTDGYLRAEHGAGPFGAVTASGRPQSVLAIVVPSAASTRSAVDRRRHERRGPLPSPG